MKIDKNNVTYYQDENGNTDFRLANITSYIAEGLDFYDDESIPGYWLYIPVCMRLEGKLDTERLKAALQHFIDSNQGLRMTLIPSGEGYKFRIINEIKLNIETEVLPFSDPEENFEAAKKEVLRVINEVPDLENECLFHFRLFRLGENDHFLAMLFNHIAIDGQSMGVAVKQIVTSYLGIEVKELYSECSFMDFYKAQEKSRTEEVVAKNAEYWRNEFRDLPKVDYSGRKGERPHTNEDFYLALSSAPIKEFCRKNNVTISSLIISAFHYAQTALYGERDTAVTYSVANRMQLSHFTIVGPIVQLLSHRLKIEENDSYADILKKTGKKVAENVRYGNVWNKYIGSSRFVLSFMNQGGIEMTSSMGDGLDEVELIPGLKTTMWQLPMIVNGISTYYLLVCITETKENIEISFAANTKFMPAEDLELFKKYIRQAIDDMLSDASQTVRF